MYTSAFVAIAAPLLMQSGNGNTQLAARDPLENGWFGRSANWVEDAGLNRLYHNEGGGLRKVMINTTTPHDGNTYFTVSANVTESNRFVGLGINSPNTTAYPFISYRSGPNPTYPGAIHWFDPNNGGSWVLHVNGSTVLRATSDGNIRFLGETKAQAYTLETARTEFVAVNRYDGGVNFSNGEALHSLNLPHGSQIAAFSARVVDQSSSNVTVSLVRFDHNAATYTVVASVTSSGSSGSPTTYSTTSINLSINIVDNENFRYHVYYQPTPPDQFGNPTSEFRSAKAEVLVSEL